jgi:hypothetical protein
MVSDGCSVSCGDDFASGDASSRNFGSRADAGLPCDVSERFVAGAWRIDIDLLIRIYHADRHFSAFQSFNYLKER